MNEAEKKQIWDRIDQLVKSKPVAIFMKGTPDFPVCGFSARAVDVLRAAGVQDEDLAHFDVLSDGGVTRAVLQEYSNWPTTPQVFIKGQFIGGSDIVMEMFEAGDLQKLL